jgi:Bifunctional DNA primase/polymerase, N-terminal
VKPWSEWLEDPLIWALAYASHGFAVLPLRSLTPHGDCDCGRRECAEDPTKRAKHPRTAHGWEDATTDEAQIRQWWTWWPEANIGMATTNRLVVVDIDPRHGGDETWAELCAGHELPECPTTRTGSGGWHHHFGTVARQGSGALGPGVDVKAMVDGRAGYVVVPPSITFPGSYTWETIGVPIPPLPDWLQPEPRDEAQLTVPLASDGSVDPTYAIGALKGEAERARVRRDGDGRRDQLFKGALRLSHFVPPLNPEDIVAVLTAAGVESGLSADSAAMHVRNGLKTALGAS